ncbi:MAG TPA: hypothetical protein VEN81_12120, partial [Planctomycetota bacterium]|nr:hypothetical protein [Planctomycetota bacterium]
DGPVLNLLSIYRSSGDTKGEREMLERVEKLAPTNRMRLWAAAHWVALAEGERAEKLLAGFEPASREEDHQAAVEALFVAAVRGRPDRALELFGEEASRRVSTAEKFEWIRAIEARASSLPDALRSTWTAEAVGALLDRGQKVRPGELVYRLARSSLLRSQGKTTAAAAELLEAAPEDPEAVARALEVLDPVRMPGAPGEAPAEPQADPDAPRLVAALGKVARGDPRLPYQAGRALAGAGKPQEARTMYEAALEACRTTPPGKPFHAAAMRVALLLGSEKGPEGWREKCVEVFLSIGKAGGAVPQDILLDEARSPIGAVLTDLVARKEWSRFYRMASASIRIAGANYLIGRHREGIEGAGLAAIKSEVWKEKDPEKFIEFADFLEGFHEGPELVEALERAHALAPKDLEIFERLAHKYLEGGPAGKAKAAVAELLPQVPADRRAGLQMELAQYFLGHQEPAKAQETLSAISLPNLDGPSAIRCAELLGQARDWDRAIAACRRAYETGLKPHFQMGRCFEMKKEFYEAFRYYNRDRLEGSSSGPPDPESEVVVVKRQMRGAVPHPTPVEPDPTTGQEARDRLLKELGSDWLLKRFLDQPFAPLGGEEERRLKAALEKLSSDAVDDRDSGVEALRSLGPQATPLLRPLLKSTDEEVKTRVRQLLQEWSEPR